MTCKKLSKKQLLNKSKKCFVKKSRSIKRKLRKLTKLKGGANDELNPAQVSKRRLPQIPSQIPSISRRQLPKVKPLQTNPFLMTQEELQALQQSQLTPLTPLTANAPAKPPRVRRPRASASESAQLTPLTANAPELLPRRSRESVLTANAPEPRAPEPPPRKSREESQTQKIASESPYQVFGNSRHANINSDTLLKIFLAPLKDVEKKYLKKMAGKITYNVIDALVSDNTYTQKDKDRLLPALNKYFNKKTESVYAIPTRPVNDFPIKINQQEVQYLRQLYERNTKITFEDIKPILESELLNQTSFLHNEEVRQFFVNTKGQIDNKKDAVKALVAYINYLFEQEQKEASNA